jgi:hypothetical protein
VSQSEITASADRENSEYFESAAMPDVGILTPAISDQYVADWEAEGYRCTNPVDHVQTTAGLAEMITIPQLTAQALGSFLARETEGRFRSSHSDLTKLLPFAARLTLECIGNSDALYHDIEHTMLVTLVGHDILAGRALQRTTTATDYANFIMACLTHDIGYVRGIVQGDEDAAYVRTLPGERANCRLDRPMPRSRPTMSTAQGCSSLSGSMPWMKLTRLELPEPSNTRVFPTPRHQREMSTTSTRKRDLIGQLGDPNYMRKSNALFREFEEIGLNKTLGYGTPADIVSKFPNVAPQIQLAIRYLNVTLSGRQWIANLHSNVFRAERQVNLSGPQR